MRSIGAHVSIAGGIANAPLNASKIGAGGFALFTKNQRQWKVPPLGTDDIRLFNDELVSRGYSPKDVLPHDGYLINLGGPEAEKRGKALASFIDEVKRVEALGLDRLNFHPGSSLKKITPEESMGYIIEGINHALSETESAVLVIENTAGAGGTIGRSFEEIAYLVSGAMDKERIGVCLDTCHAFAAGYDFRTRDAYNKFMDEFDKIVGFKYLKGMHLNDSKGELGSHLDRHESLGKGVIGKDAFRFLMKDPRIDNIPMILETPNPDLWPEEIKFLYLEEGSEG